MASTVTTWARLCGDLDIGETEGLVAGRRAAAQLCVEQGGRVLFEGSWNCAPTSLFWIFSASKPLTTVLVHRAAACGLLDLDDPVRTHWPTFRGHGKSRITTRHVLRHRTGMPTAAGPLGDALAMTDWDRSVRLIECGVPRWEPGRVVAYQFVIYGFVLGELLRRLTGQEITEQVAEQILTPLGMADTYLGLPPGAWDRHVPLDVRGPRGPVVGPYLNRRRVREAVIPSAGISTTARDMTRFYRGLLDGRLLDAASLAGALTPTSDGQMDRFAREPIRWAEGFQLGGPRGRPGALEPMGYTGSSAAFGHNGSGCCIAWADPTRDLTFAYLTNRMTGLRPDAHHLAAVADGVLAAVDARGGRGRGGR